MTTTAATAAAAAAATTTAAVPTANPNAKYAVVRSGVVKDTASHQNALKKKILNIPVGNVVLDPDYNTSILPNYTLPTAFIRHTKKIGDEPDKTVDYFMEDVDLDKEVMSLLTVEIFENIITFLEKSTGFSSELIPLLHAEKQLMEKFHWSATTTHKILVEIYSYWIKKRDCLHKPLCRKYWLATPSTDTNPHHCFRPRDKERYRLRKQQRKNDIEAFRKMQQLRREFGAARELLQLVLDREALQEADFETRKRIFDLELLAIEEENCLNTNNSNNNSTNKEQSSSSSSLLLLLSPLKKVKLNFPHLLDVHTASLRPMVSPPLPKTAGRTTTTTTTTNRMKSESLGNAVVVAVDGEEEEEDFGNPVFKKKDRKQKRKSNNNNNNNYIDINGGDDSYLQQQQQQSSTTTGGGGGTTTTASSSLPWSIPVVAVAEGLPGPPYQCRPLWPSFMEQQQQQQQQQVTQSMFSQSYLRYLEELEVNVPTAAATTTTTATMIRGIPGYSCNSRVAIPKQTTTTTTTPSTNALSQQQQQQQQQQEQEEVEEELSLPQMLSFKCRARIGRSGRVVVDRIPIVVNNNNNSNSNNNNNNNNNDAAVVNGSSHRWVYVVDPPQSKSIHRGSGSEFIPNNNNNNNNSSYSNNIINNTSSSNNNNNNNNNNSSFPVTVPMSSSLLSAGIAAAARDVLYYSDSEDEAVGFGQNPVVVVHKQEKWKEGSGLVAKYSLRV